MESPRQKETTAFDQSEEIIQEEPLEEFEASPIRDNVRSNSLHLASTSVSSTNSSRSHSLNRSIDAPNSIYPNIVLHPLKGISKRRMSLPMKDFGESVKEEEAAQEIDETRISKLKQFKSFRDYGEFSTRDRKRNRTFERNQHEPRAKSFDRLDLPQVQEAKNEEDRVASNFTIERRWMGLKDCDEFNTKVLNRKSKDKLTSEGELLSLDHKTNSEKRSRKFSVSIDEDPIPEEEMRENRGRQGHIHPSYIPSPKMNKLKVDEIDFERKKSEFEQYQNEIDDDEEILLTTNDVIKEDASEYGPILQAEELFEKAKQKMTGEREFLKKFLRSESNDELDKMRSTIEREQSYTQSKVENIEAAIEEENVEAEQ